MSPNFQPKALLKYKEIQMQNETSTPNKESSQNFYEKVKKWLFSEQKTWIHTLLMVGIFVVPFFLYLKPEQHTPVVQVLLNIIFAYLAYQVGIAKEVKRAEKLANRKWLPQAEAVTKRLITLKYIIKKQVILMKRGCIKTLGLQAIQPRDIGIIQTRSFCDCKSAVTRLEDVDLHLDDAIDDWRSFIADNCEGEECNRIWRSLDNAENKHEYFHILEEMSDDEIASMQKNGSRQESINRIKANNVMKRPVG